MTDQKETIETKAPEVTLQEKATIPTAGSSEKKALSEEEKKEVLEAILFAAGFAVPYDKLAELLGMSSGKMKRFVEGYAGEYNAVPGRGILLLAMEDRCQLCTKAEYKDYIRDALGIRLSGKLSPSCLEVLAIIAYHQPVTKAYIEQVRGVDCSYALGSLLDKALVAATGRLEAPGRPMLYGTTDDFLRCFGISSLEELPDRKAAQPGVTATEAASAAASAVDVPDSPLLEQVPLFAAENTGKDGENDETPGS